MLRRSQDRLTRKVACLTFDLANNSEYVKIMYSFKLIGNEVGPNLEVNVSRIDEERHD